MKSIDPGNISIDEVKGSCVKDGKLFIKYKKKNLFLRIMGSDITEMIIIFGSLIIGALAIGFALMGK